MGRLVFCGQNCMGNTKYDKKPLQQKTRQIKKQIDQLVDLPNYVDPKTFSDKQDRVRYMFPFYRTDINQFEEQVESIEGLMKVDVVNSTFISIQQIKQAFSGSPAWSQSWPQTEALLKSFMFKELVMTYTTDGTNYHFNQNKQQNYLSKLDLAILGLMWCSGTQKQKAWYMTKLMKSPTITRDNSELKFIFKKLFYFSINLVDKYIEIKIRMEENLDDQIKKLQSEVQKMKTEGIYIEKSLKLNDLNNENGISEKEVKKMIKEQHNYLTNFYNELFVDSIFPDKQNTISAQQLGESLCMSTFEYLFDPMRLRQKFTHFSSIMNPKKNKKEKLSRQHSPRNLQKSQINVENIKNYLEHRDKSKESNLPFNDRKKYNQPLHTSRGKPIISLLTPRGQGGISNSSFGSRKSGRRVTFKGLSSTPSMSGSRSLHDSFSKFSKKSYQDEPEQSSSFCSSFSVDSYRRNTLLSDRNIRKTDPPKKYKYLDTENKYKRANDYKINSILTPRKVSHISNQLSERSMGSYKHLNTVRQPSNHLKIPIRNDKTNRYSDVISGHSKSNHSYLRKQTEYITPTPRKSPKQNQQITRVLSKIDGNRDNQSFSNYKENSIKVHRVANIENESGKSRERFKAQYTKMKRGQEAYKSYLKTHGYDDQKSELSDYSQNSGYKKGRRRPSNSYRTVRVYQTPKQ